MLIAEDLLLLLTDDSTGKVAAAQVDTGLGGALLVDLAAAGRVAFSGPHGKPVVHVVDPTPTGHHLLYEALRRLAEQREEKAPKAVERLGKGARDALFAVLAERGLVRREDGRVLGLFPRTTWPTVDGSAEARTRAELHAALVQGTTPTTRAAALASLLLALDQLGLVVDRAERRAATARAKQIAAGDAVGDGVAAAVKAANDAATVAIVASSAAATTAAVTST